MKLPAKAYSVATVIGTFLAGEAITRTFTVNGGQLTNDVCIEIAVALFFLVIGGLLLFPKTKRRIVQYGGIAVLILCIGIVAIFSCQDLLWNKRHQLNAATMSWNDRRKIDKAIDAFISSDLCKQLECKEYNQWHDDFHGPGSWEYLFSTKEGGDASDRIAISTDNGNITLLIFSFRLHGSRLSEKELNLFANSALALLSPGEKNAELSKSIADTMGTPRFGEKGMEYQFGNYTIVIAQTDNGRSPSFIASRKK
jgi:hypothetical protein